MIIHHDYKKNISTLFESDSAKSQGCIKQGGWVGDTDIGMYL